MKLEQLKELIRVLEESGVEEIEVSSWGRRVRVSKSGNSYLHGATVPASLPEAAPAAVEPAAAEPGPAETPKNGKQMKEIKSPMVGTFYRAPTPGAPPFVEMNADIDVGQTVCIIEAMKLMNEIQSEARGRVARILVENAKPVQYGQTLFLIEPY
ncbi:MAG: acetyl-CoA carboxylase biotin carboxyl carrier protein [Candidatus Eisenbacteria bacterium]|nr:acetyl-CoA carboxylase biotin carboxyl carrier protein [Candidatus Eisenbacteria bacterium]